MKRFTDFEIKKSILPILSKNGFVKPTPIQSETIPVMLNGKDVIVNSQTGSGKTLAFLLPTLSRISPDAKSAQILIITPTRELCLQIKNVIDLFEIESSCFIGGVPIEDDIPKMSVPVYVSTPGRLLELILLQKKSFQKIKYLVIDECDKLFGFGFETKMEAIIGYLPRARQTGLFSATINDSVKRLSMKLLKNPVSIKIKDEKPENLESYYLVAAPREKLNILVHFSKDPKIIVFFATCAQVDYYSDLLSIYWHDKKCVHRIHGKMGQSERSTVYGGFQEKGGVLLCTDVAARGIDFHGVDTVLHFDVPKEYQNIVHRSGRTARNGNGGRSILLLMPNEMPYVKFLKINKIEIENLEVEKIEDIFSEISLLIDDELQSKIVKGFVAYIRSYKEHLLNYILDLKQIDFDSLAELFFLKKIPSMKELSHVKFTKFEHVISKEPSAKRVKKNKVEKNRVKKNKKV